MDLVSDPKCYRVFVRTWWKRNAAWPDGKEPHVARGRTIRRNLTYREAMRMCADWNSENKPGKYGRKAEFTKQ